jgi:hypothetical protein
MSNNRRFALDEKRPPAGSGFYKAQMAPLHTWRDEDRAEIQGLLDIATS